MSKRPRYSEEPSLELLGDLLRRYTELAEFVEELRESARETGREDVFNFYREQKHSADYLRCDYNHCLKRLRTNKHDRSLGKRLYRPKHHSQVREVERIELLGSPLNPVLSQ